MPGDRPAVNPASADTRWDGESLRRRLVFFSTKPATYPTNANPTRSHSGIISSPTATVATTTRAATRLCPP